VSTDELREYTTKLMVELEKLNNITSDTDPAVVDEIDLNNKDDIKKVVSKVKELETTGGKLISGWQELNTMTQGGFKRGEFVLVPALPHQYKSGFLRSLFMQICMHNKPIVTDKLKKPLNIYLSFEDNSDVAIDFMYRYLYYNEYNKLPDYSKVTNDDISDYITTKLTAMGYNIKILRVDPSDWTYRKMLNKIFEYETQGYEIHTLVIDYLSMLPTTGCIGGPNGADYKDMFKRVRNATSARNILTITAHQLSTDAKQLTRALVSDMKFIAEVKNKGYYEHSRGLDQIVDLEIYIHKAKVDKRPVLTIGRGKHRTPGIIDEKLMFFYLKFPLEAPIPDNLGKTIENNIVMETDDDFDL